MGLQPVAISPLNVYKSVPRQVCLLWLWCQGHPRSGWGQTCTSNPRALHHLLESKSLGTRDQGIL